MVEPEREDTDEVFKIAHRILSGIDPGVKPKPATGDHPSVVEAYRILYESGPIPMGKLGIYAKTRHEPEAADRGHTSVWISNND